VSTTIPDMDAARALVAHVWTHRGSGAVFHEDARLVAATVARVWGLKNVHRLRKIGLRVARPLRRIGSDRWKPCDFDVVVGVVDRVRFRLWVEKHGLDSALAAVEVEEALRGDE